MNPLNNTLGSGNNNLLGLLSNLSNFVSLFKTQNEQQIIQILSQQNPNFKQFVDSMQGQNIQQVFEEQCKKNGMNSQQVLNQVQQLLGK